MEAGKPNVAFAGLGAMGFGMATNLLKCGYQVTGYDVYQPTLDRFIAEGGKSASTPSKAAEDAEFFICMVVNAEQAGNVLFEKYTGACLTLPKEATILICSTVAPADIDVFHKKLERTGRTYLRLIDCPVSGGAARAADGLLSIFAAGKEADLVHANQILECMSSKLYKIPGGLGGGSKAKLIHQIFAGVNIAMASEAMGLAAAAGLNTQEAFDYLKYSDGNSWMFSNRVPHMLDPSLPPYSAINIIAKDVGIITSTARDWKFALPMLSMAEQLYTTAISAGWGKEDDCVMTRLYLPNRPDLVTEQVKSSKTSETPQLQFHDIKFLLIGVHVAVISEAMTFCEKLGIDTDIMFDIVSNAAGSSAMFSLMFKDMQKENWSLGALHSTDLVRYQLSESVRKANAIRYPVFLSSAALQEFYRQLSTFVNTARIG
ncbi:hypothetical protein JMJ35_007220 [Cladonia borealis]|uniref:3-hydroxyisobutyrate dehydrogenase n=1 Tax=Cladonia borealis TaxID=184061 RepID=A0AA39QZX3_9LECA|nr:hypothetical protein JMJ35_007220 [Cladonia borealis]